MASTPRSSFIPKQVTSSAIPQKVRRTRVFSIVGFFASLILFAAVLASGGVFFYKNFIVERDLEAMKVQLESERTKFNDGELRDIKNFDLKIELAKSILDEHIAPSRVFDALEARTKQSVQYTSFTYTKRPSGNVTVELSGVTDEFAKVALQSMQYQEDLVLSNAYMTSVGLGTHTATPEEANPGLVTKQISFTLVANVEGSDIAYTPVTSFTNVEEMPVFDTAPTDAATTATTTTDVGTDTEIEDITL